MISDSDRWTDTQQQFYTVTTCEEEASCSSRHSLFGTYTRRCMQVPDPTTHPDRPPTDQPDRAAHPSIPPSSIVHGRASHPLLPSNRYVLYRGANATNSTGRYRRRPLAKRVFVLMVTKYPRGHKNARDRPVSYATVAAICRDFRGAPRITHAYNNINDRWPTCGSSSNI